MRILFVGNSHTFFNDMPEIFRYLYKAGTGEDAEVTMQAHPGVTFGWHLSQEAELRYALLHGRYDYLVLQQAAHEPCPSPQETLQDGGQIIAHAKALGIQPIVCMPWCEKRLPQHQQTMFETYTKLCQDNGCLMEVTGYVFEEVRQNHPEINLYFYDGEHCNPYGSYVRALGVYAAITGRSPIGLPARAIRSYRVTDESIALHYPAYQLQMDQDPGNTALQEKSREFWANVHMQWDLEKLWLDLDPEQARILQEYVARYAEEKNRGRR